MLTDELPVCMQRWVSCRVEPEHYCPSPPSEPCLRLSPHTAQAEPNLCFSVEKHDAVGDRLGVAAASC